MLEVEERQVRADFTDEMITVYQAYSNAIAEAALAAQRFVSPFKLDRMTWIKPSFLWMMYRSGWGRKPGQERILAVRMSRSGFAWALSNACLTRYDPGIYPTSEAWSELKRTAPVRIQWDPERTVALARLPDRTIQIGLAGVATERYAREWVRRIDEVTGLAHEVEALVGQGRETEAIAALPNEKPYPLPADLARAIGCSGTQARDHR